MYYLTKVSKVSSLWLYWGCARVVFLPRCLSFIHLSQVVLCYGTAVCLCPSIRPHLHVCSSVHPPICQSAFCLSLFIHMYVHECYTPVTGRIMVWRSCLSLSIHPSKSACPSVHPSVCLSVRPSCLYLSIQTYVHEFYTPVTGRIMVWRCCLSLSIHPSIHVCLSVGLSICPNFCLSVRTYVCTWVLYTRHRLYYGMALALLLVFLSIHPSIHVCLYVHLFGCHTSVHILFVSVPTWVLYTHHRSYNGVALVSVSLSIRSCLPVSPSVHQPDRPSVSVHTYVCTYLGLSTHPSVYTYSCLYVSLQAWFLSPTLFEGKRGTKELSLHGHWPIRPLV